jgi:hypothetical protein
MIRKRIVLTLLLSLKLFLAGAQSFTYPVLSNMFKDFKTAVPANWKIKSVANGDLNGDNVADVAMVIEYYKAIKEQRPDNVTNLGRPRLLLIWFKEGNGYRLALQNNTIIMRSGEAGMVNDAFDNLSITKRILNIDYEFVRSHWYYKYRYQQNNFYLIGATLGGVSGNNIEDRDYNFSTRKAIFKFDTIDGDKAKTEYKKIKISKLNSLHEATIPMEWAVN